MKKLAVSLLLLSGLAWAAPTQTLDATFVGVEQGDYAHLNVKDAAGKLHSFFVLTGDASFTPYLDHPEKHKGEKVRVTWHHTKKKLEQGEIEMDEALKIAGRK